MYTCICMYRYLCILFIYTYIFVCVCVCVYIYIYTHTHIYVHFCIYIFYWLSMLHYNWVILRAISYIVSYHGVVLRFTHFVSPLGYMVIVIVGQNLLILKRLEMSPRAS
jgi:hypothetical protein